MWEFVRQGEYFAGLISALAQDRIRTRAQF
jgi:hypothetical protein